MPSEREGGISLILNAEGERERVQKPRIRRGCSYSLLHCIHSELIRGFEGSLLRALQGLSGGPAGGFPQGSLLGDKSSKDAKQEEESLSLPSPFPLSGRRLKGRIFLHSKLESSREEDPSFSSVSQSVCAVAHPSPPDEGAAARRARWRSEEAKLTLQSCAHPQYETAVFTRKPVSHRHREY